MPYANGNTALMKVRPGEGRRNVERVAAMVMDRAAGVNTVKGPSMPSHYACYAGMLLYVSEQFRDAAQAEHDPRFGAYADMLDRIVGDLMGREDGGQAVPQGSNGWQAAGTDGRWTAGARRGD